MKLCNKCQQPIEWEFGIKTQKYYPVHPKTRKHHNLYCGREKLDELRTRRIAKKIEQELDIDFKRAMSEDN